MDDDAKLEEAVPEVTDLSAPAEPEKETKAAVKRKRRVVNFPTSTYEESLEIATAIWKFASGQKIRRITLFDKLQKSPDSSLSRAIITSSGKYKITIGSYSAEFLELTEDGFTATNPDGKAIEKLEANFKLAVQSNEFFSKLYENYKDMRLPDKSVMADFLSENGLSRDQCDQCVETFIVNCKFLNIIQPLAGSERIVTIDYLKDEILKTGNEEEDNRNSIHPVIESESPIISGPPIDKRDGQSDDTDIWDSVCFFIAPIGDDDSEERKHSDLFLGQIVGPVLNQFRLKVIRADKINTAGVITSQIIEHIIKAKIVIADLSFHNPNVFYELSLRHAQNKSAIHIIRKCDKIPFDLNSFRTITIDDSSIYTLLPQLESYKAQLSSQVRKILDNPEEVENPITAYFQSTKIRSIK